MAYVDCQYVCIVKDVGTEGIGCLVDGCCIPATARILTNTPFYSQPVSTGFGITWTLKMLPGESESIGSSCKRYALDDLSVLGSTKV